MIPLPATRQIFHRSVHPMHGPVGSCTFQDVVVERLRERGSRWWFRPFCLLPDRQLPERRAHYLAGAIRQIASVHCRPHLLDFHAPFPEHKTCCPCTQVSMNLAGLYHPIYSTYRHATSRGIWPISILPPAGHWVFRGGRSTRIRTSGGTAKGNSLPNQRFKRPGGPGAWAGAGPINALAR